ncbi:DNA-directed RNA polymerase subunit omega [candidate division NPL-UPA2 bacterium]|nr:DNA-directed RNA polymerase subunit omega [candidate division NPL-UPA2 bacterium]
MNNVSMEKSRVNIGNVYKLVIVASKRVRQLNEGSPKLVDTDSIKPMTIALEEIAAGKIGCKEESS